MKHRATCRWWVKDHRWEYAGRFEELVTRKIWWVQSLCTRCGAMHTYRPADDPAV